MPLTAPPPVPQRLREILKDYPEQIEELQAALNRVAEKPSSGIPTFEQAMWALEDALNRLTQNARKETKAAEADGDPEAIQHATARESLMFRAASKMVWVGDRALSEYFRGPGKLSSLALLKVNSTPKPTQKFFKRRCFPEAI